jgi:hypothetical protein
MFKGRRVQCLLSDETGRAAMQQVRRQVGFGVSGQQHDEGRRDSGEDAPGRLDAADTWEPDVHQDQVWPQATCQATACSPVSASATIDVAVLSLEQSAPPAGTAAGRPPVARSVGAGTGVPRSRDAPREVLQYGPDTGSIFGWSPAASDLGSLHDFYRAVILAHQHDLELGKKWL